MKDIYFSHKYDKLNYPIFPTIRGISNHPMKKGNYTITLEGRILFTAKLIYQKVMQIENIPIDFLNWDFGPNRIVKTHLEACNYLNQFRRRYWLDPSKYVLILIFEKGEMKKWISKN